VWQEIIQVKNLFMSLRILFARFFEISTSSDRIWTAAVREFLSNSMQIFFFMKKKNIDCGVRTADIS
jgi:hypothetical protein